MTSRRTWGILITILFSIAATISLVSKGSEWGTPAPSSIVLQYTIYIVRSSSSRILPAFSHAFPHATQSVLDNADPT